MNHLAQWPSSICGCTSTWTQVPAGVFAFQDETSSLNPNDRFVTPEVHVPDRYSPEPSTPSPE